MSLARWAHRLIEKNRRSRNVIRNMMANVSTLAIVPIRTSSPRAGHVSILAACQGGTRKWFSNIRIANEERLSVEEAYFYSQNPPNHFS